MYEAARCSLQGQTLQYVFDDQGRVVHVEWSEGYVFGPMYLPDEVILLAEEGNRNPEASADASLPEPKSEGQAESEF